MKTVSMARSLQDSSSKRHFHWTNKVGNEEEDDHVDVLPTLKSSSSSKATHHQQQDKKETAASQLPTRKLQARLRSVLTAFGKNRSSLPLGLGPRVIGTLFGSRRGHVHFALQRDPNSHPALLIELATPISGLVKEMASGLVRIALECDKHHHKDRGREDEKKKERPALRLLEEPVWRTFCNGKKYGFATRRECGPKEWKVLKAVEPISMGAGVLPPAAGKGKGNDSNEAEAVGSESDGEEFMYMRAKFERIVGSRDSEAFYMMNPDSNGAPELSIYLLRI